MGSGRTLLFAGAVLLLVPGAARLCHAQSEALPAGVKAVWDLDKATHETTPTSERVCINGLWRFQPANMSAKAVPDAGWGFRKVPGAWNDSSQTGYGAGANGNTGAAWYQREITIPQTWAGRRIAVSADYLNSYAAVYVNGKKLGEMAFPGGEVEITSACQPGQKCLLSLEVKAVPLSAVVAVFNDTSAPTTAAGKVERPGLCGDVFLLSSPAAARVADVKVNPSVRNWAITFDVALQGLENGKSYTLRAEVADGAKKAGEFTSDSFSAANVKNGRFSFTAKWKPEKLWDLHTPQNMYSLSLTLADTAGKPLDVFRPVRFGFREFWIKERDFYLNGSRVYCFVIPIENAQMGAGFANYAACRETLQRMKAYGVNTVYTHNYGSPPGAHLSFEELMRAADDTGILMAVSQPVYAHYKWNNPDAEFTRHVGFYVRMVENHPAVVMYATNFNALAYGGSFDPALMDGKHNNEGKIGPRTDQGALNGLHSQAIIESLDPTRVVYHHSSGTLGHMHTLNLYLNFTPIQERSDWFEHWATEGIIPLYLCEYGIPWDINWTTYRGWYKGVRAWGSADAAYEFTEGEWNSQFLGDAAFKLNDKDKANIRWETKQWQAGRSWKKWDYPYQPSKGYSWGHPNKDQVYAMYIKDNWRAYRTWGVSGMNGWGWGDFWELRPGVTQNTKTCKVDWDNLQKPGFSPDHVDQRAGNYDAEFEVSDWIPTAAAKALSRNNMPLLAYIAGKTEHFTTKEHNYLAGQAATKQLIVINNSRQTVTADCSWSLALPTPVTGGKNVTVETGEQAHIPMNFALPAGLQPGAYDISMTVKFGTGETQLDTFTLNVLPPRPDAKVAARVALFDPKGETGKLLTQMGVHAETVAATANLAGYDTLIVGKAALTLDGPAPDISRVADGLKVVLFEQTSDVLEKRFGFRVQEYGLRNVFTRVPDHPLLAGLTNETLHDWSGQATIMPFQLTNYTERPRLGPTIEWCGITVPRIYRAGNWGNVASVLIEKPARGNFLPIVDGGYSLEYSPLMEYREGKGLVVLCQMDVTGRTKEDPAANRLVANILNYVSTYTAPPVRKVAYAGAAAGSQHLAAGLNVTAYAGGAPGADDVLVVGPGAGQTLSANADALRAWVKAGGHVLAVGLSQEEANAFLPVAIQTKKEEYICSVFNPPEMKSLLAGVGAADVMNRDPRNLNLITGGATVTADGALAFVPGANVAFCQLVPWEFDYQKYFNMKRTFRRASFLVTRILGNLGAAEPAPLLERFASPFKAGEKRWTSGFYLEQPQEFDDPYRYFQW